MTFAIAGNYSKPIFACHLNGYNFFKKNQQDKLICNKLLHKHIRSNLTSTNCKKNKSSGHSLSCF